MQQTYGYAYHAHLVASMAHTLSVDLQDEVEASHLSRRVLNNAVQRCMSCPDPAGCELWLSMHDGGATGAPNLCLNKALLENLR